MGLCQSQHEKEYKNNPTHTNTIQTKTEETTINSSKEKNINKNHNKQEDIIAINSGMTVNPNKENIKDNYQILSKIGEGSYGVVWKVRHKRTNLIRAMKKITKNLLSKTETVNEIKNEIELLKSLDHPNIVKIFEFFIDFDGYYLITEYLQGGELFDAIKKNGPFFEPIAANIMYQILSAVNYCHSTNIIHRDLKPENILIDSINQNTGFLTIKIIDFGTAKIYEKNKNENKIIGSSYYIAPEVLEKNYNEKCDMWSCGVILYTLLSGKLPFTGRKQGEILRKVLLGKYDMKGEYFESVSYEAKDLVKKCLEKDVNNRISARDALMHPWFNKYQTRQFFCQVTEYFLEKTLDNIKKYKPKNKLQELALTYLVHNLPELDEIKLLYKVFNLFNTNGNGKLTKKEVKDALHKYMFKNSKHKHKIGKQAEEIFKNIDNDNNGFIECEEFARAGIDKKILKEPNILKFSFDFIDKDHSGDITINELKEVFKIKKKEDETLLKKMIKSMDTDSNGKISYSEYKHMMLKIIDQK